MVDRYEAVERFARLRDEGVISEEEFAAEKAKLLGGAEAAPDLSTMRPATIVAPVPRSRWPLWLGLGTLVVVAVVAGLLLATRPDQSVSPPPAATTAVTHEPPSCDSAVTRDLLTKAFSTAGDTLVAVGHMDRGIINATRDLRTCTADLTLAGKGVQNRTFQLFAPENGGPLQLSFLDMTAPASAAPAGNTAAAEDSTAAIEDGTPEDQARLIAADAKKIITTTDAQGNPICCVNVGDVVRFFSSQSGSATIETTEGDDFTIDVKDPAGRWRGLTAFELAFSKVGDGKMLVRLDGLSINDEPLQGIDAMALLRASFNLRPSGTAPGGE